MLCVLGSYHCQGTAGQGRSEGEGTRTYIQPRGQRCVECHANGRAAMMVEDAEHLHTLIAKGCCHLVRSAIQHESTSISTRLKALRVVPLELADLKGKLMQKAIPHVTKATS